jgi:hypothetical protein
LSTVRYCWSLEIAWQEHHSNRIQHGTTTHEGRLGGHLQLVLENATFYALRFLSQVLMLDQQDRRNITQLDSLLAEIPRACTLLVTTFCSTAHGSCTLPRSLSGLMDMLLMAKSTNPMIWRTSRKENACLGLLVMVRDIFSRTKWELLHEVSALLTNCIEKLAGGQQVVIPDMDT